jgi:hypothetical protein
VKALGNLKLQNASNQEEGVRQWESYLEQTRGQATAGGAHDTSASTSTSTSNRTGGIKDSEFKTMVRGGVRRIVGRHSFIGRHSFVGRQSIIGSRWGSRCGWRCTHASSPPIIPLEWRECTSRLLTLMTSLTNTQVPSQSRSEALTMHSVTLMTSLTNTQVPSQCRGEVWRLLVENKVGFEKKSCDAGLEISYYHRQHTTTTRGPSVATKQIELDLLRTFPTCGALCTNHGFWNQTPIRRLPCSWICYERSPVHEACLQPWVLPC